MPVGMVLPQIRSLTGSLRMGTSCAEAVPDASPSNCSEASSGTEEENTEGVGVSDSRATKRGKLIYCGVGTLFLLTVGAATWLHMSRHSGDGDELGADEPIAGVNLQPSAQALPALPAMPAALPALPEEHDPVEARSALRLRGRPPPAPLKTYTQPSVVFGMLITNVMYERLVEASNFYQVFNATVKQAVASEAGIGVEPEDVELEVSPDRGSVIVECTIVMDDPEVASDVQVRITSSSRLAYQLGMNLRALTHMAATDVSSGRIEVASISDPNVYGTKEPTTITTTTGPSTTTGPPTPAPTTTVDCNPKGQACFVHSQCCSGRCGGSHKCLPGMSDFALTT